MQKRMKKHMPIIKFFDTTLRDGEQSPGVNLNKEEKLQIAKQLERYGMDRIEAGFPASSKGDFEAVQAIAQNIKKSTVLGLARTVKSDIDAVYEAVKDAAKPAIHVFIATSPIHMKYKLKKSPEEVVETAVSMVRYAKEKFNHVEWSAEDATRSDKAFLAEIIEKVIDAGATVINLPDTVGYATPEDYGSMFRYIKENVLNIDKVELSCHCHNDLGLAVANTLSAIQNGVTQVEGAINGIGERAGNVALEEVALALHVRSDYFPYASSLKFDETKRTSDLVSKLTGMYVQANKAIVGRNAFSHESGIHQDGVLKHAETYEIITPALVGVTPNTLFLGKHSGRHAFKDKVNTFGIELTEAELKEAFEQFKQLTDHKKEVTDDDIYAIVMEIKTDSSNIDKYELIQFGVSYDTQDTPSATVVLKAPNGVNVEATEYGSGSVEALYKTINSLIDEEITLTDYQLNSVGGGKDALAEAHVQIKINEQINNGRGTAQDVLQASANALIQAINRYYVQKKATIKQLVHE